MFGSLDCMHKKWKNCLVVWQGDFGYCNGNKFIILEAMAREDLHIWHAFFGQPDSNNDLNVLNRFSFLQNILTSKLTNRVLEVNGCHIIGMTF